MREFLYVDNLADACVYLMERNHSGSQVNIGTGTDVTIHELATIIMDVVGFKSDIVFDASKPDGTMRKVMDVSKLAELGWQSKTTLEQGIAKTYKHMLNTLDTA